MRFTRWIVEWLSCDESRWEACMATRYKRPYRDGSATPEAIWLEYSQIMVRYNRLRTTSLSGRSNIDSGRNQF